MSVFGAGGLAIGGHHVSYGLLAVILGVPVAGLAIYQIQKGGGISAGSPASAPAGTTGSMDTTGLATEAELANLQAEISGLANQTNPPLPTAGPPPSGKLPPYVPHPVLPGQSDVSQWTEGLQAIQKASGNGAVDSQLAAWLAGAQSTPGASQTPFDWAFWEAFFGLHGAATQAAIQNAYAPSSDPYASSRYATTTKATDVASPYVTSTSPNTYPTFLAGPPAGPAPTTPASYGTTSSGWPQSGRA